MTIQLPVLHKADKDYIVLECNFVEGIKKDYGKFMHSTYILHTVI